MGILIKSVELTFDSDNKLSQIYTVSLVHFVSIYFKHRWRFSSYKIRALEEKKRHFSFREAYHALSNRLS